MQLYLFFTAILSKFTVAQAVGTHGKAISVPGRKEIGLVVSPKPFNMRIIPRQQRTYDY